MYKLHLILKYLRKRRIAWVALVAVTLCTTMVLVVNSVMGGWLGMFRDAYHSMTGDVIVHGTSLAGFPYYQEMIDAVKAEEPDVVAATPVINTFGLLAMTYEHQRMSPSGVQVMGIRPDIGEVTKFSQSLHRQKDVSRISFDLPEDRKNDFVLAATRYPATQPNFDALNWKGMIAGAGLVGIHKDKEGKIQRPPGADTIWGSLTLLPVSADSQSVDPSDKVVRPYWVVDDSRTMAVEYDSRTIYVPFDVLQKDLKMDEQKYRRVVDGREVVETSPARTTDILIALKPGANQLAALGRIEGIVSKVRERHHMPAMSYQVIPWQKRHETFIGAVEKEKLLITMLFGIISIVAIFLIFCIFYMIVVEKTRDIGIVKSVGATSQGVAGIFLGYGASIGIVGAGMGLLFGWLIVHYINELHTWLGEVLHVQIWNQDVYLFDTIPNTMNAFETACIMVVAIAAAVIGSAIPAMRAATMQPVEALRWE